MGEKHGSAPLFAVFCASILLLLLIPYTIYKFFFKPKPEVIVEPWKKKVLGCRMDVGLCCCALAG